MVDGAIATTPLGRVEQPGDVARTAAFLASPESDYVIGVFVDVAEEFFMSG
jgi:NAD(P)-dependent dehydrogenase (short-subunit alcohol dehydrogenase family)